MTTPANKPQLVGDLLLIAVTQQEADTYSRKRIERARRHASAARRRARRSR